MKRRLTLLTLALAACATSQDVFGGRTATRETQAVHVATVRWLAANYEPSEFLGDPQALCLVVAQSVGRRDIRATAQAARNEDQDPSQYVLGRLADVRPRVLPISDCVWGEDLAEVVADTGERAFVMGVSRPQWVTPDLARVEATLRENHRNWFRWRCSLVRGVEGWQIRRCT